MKCSSVSMAESITCGEPRIRRLRCWTSSSGAAGTRRPRRSSHVALLKGLQYVPRVIVTDQLRSYRAAKTEITPGVEQLQDKGLNNRAENSHQPTKLREKVMRRFKSAVMRERFLSAFGIILSHFRPGRHLYAAGGYRAVMKLRIAA